MDPVADLGSKMLSVSPAIANADRRATSKAIADEAAGTLQSRNKPDRTAKIVIPSTYQRMSGRI
jgi:hypothetical protein